MTSDQESQGAIIAWLADPQTYGTESQVERVDTHAAVVFLVGTRAYKMKRAVKFAYLDFSTPTLRRHFLTRELELNRTYAPQIYKCVSGIYRRRDGSFTFLEEQGAEAIEWVLEMSRFDRSGVLDRVAERGDLSPKAIDDLANLVSNVHAGAATHIVEDAAARFEKILLSNDAELRACAAFEPARVTALRRTTMAALDKCGKLLDERGARGFVRQCHGDLHLGNIVAINGALTLFDCLEFSDEMARIDVQYDLAFLLMDLIHQKLPHLANRLLNGYLAAVPFCDLQDQLRGLRLLSLFISCRAAVRAHVAGRRHAQNPIDSKNLVLAFQHLALAEKALAPHKPEVIAVGGLSGSGKTTLARGLGPFCGPIYGCVILRTDVLRKQKAALAHTQKLPPSAYSENAASIVYDDLIRLAGAALASGQTVILDGVFASERERIAAEALAKKFSVPFHGLWLEARPETMVQRLDARQGDASDAGRDVLSRQLTYDVGHIRWARIDASEESDETLSRALDVCASRSKRQE